MITVVLMDKHVDRSFTESNVVRGIVIAAHGGWINLEGMFRDARVFCHQPSPGFEKILFKNHAIVPAFVGRPCIKTGINALIIQNGSRKQATDVAIMTKEDYRSSGKYRFTVLVNQEIPLLQKFQWVVNLSLLRIATIKELLIPPECLGIDTTLHLDISDSLAIPG